MSGTYPPISDYALIGDSRSAALVSKRGSIDWLCWPRFDSPSIFAALLDVQRGGSFRIEPSIPYDMKRRYVDATNVLETTFRTSEGEVRLIDFMPALHEVTKDRLLLPYRQLCRRIVGVGGSVPMSILFAPRPDYARRIAPLQRRDGAILVENGPQIAHLCSTLPLAIHGADAGVELVLGSGERYDFALGFDEATPAVFCQVGDAMNFLLERTIAFWTEWSSKLTYEGEYRDSVLRSALTLKLLAYAPSGAIIAAPTTSLPEAIGGVRNWDYRYCWLRDASFTARALFEAGLRVEGGAFVEWLLYGTRLTQGGLQVLYDVFGESNLPEKELPWLEGYAHSKPVRIGNDAHQQFQLDIYGEVLGAVELYLDEGHKLPHDTARLISRLTDVVIHRWSTPDHGIWEKRSAPCNHTHSTVMAWMAMDAACRIAEKKQLRVPLDQWRSVREGIKRTILDRGFNKTLGFFTATWDGDDVDASLLYVARSGFLPADDPGVMATVEAIRKRLGVDDLLYRYRDTNDGIPGDEGAFLACSFWLAEVLALAGRTDEAHALMKKLLARNNDVGLFSEEIDPSSGDLRGNFPQALSHIALINAASTLMQREQQGTSPNRVEAANRDAVDHVA